MVDFWKAVLARDSRLDGPLKGLEPNLTHMNLAAENLSEWAFERPKAPSELTGANAQPIVVEVVSLASKPEEKKP